MLHPSLESRSMPLLEQLARFTERRQEAFATNIANIDTPGYKTRDLPETAFQQALFKAAQRQDQPASPTSPFSAELTSLQFPTSPFPLQPTPAQPTLDDLFTPDLFQAQPAPSENLTFQDGGNRSIEQQVMDMTKNLMTQNYVLGLMKAQFSTMQAVISERA